MFYFTSDEVTNLIARKIELFDNVLPASNSVQAINLYELGHYYYNESYSKLAKQMLSNVNDDIEEEAKGGNFVYVGRDPILCLNHNSMT